MNNATPEQPNHPLYNKPINQKENCIKQCSTAQNMPRDGQSLLNHNFS
jgi:hypothetical protein